MAGRIPAIFGFFFFIISRFFYSIAFAAGCVFYNSLQNFDPVQSAFCGFVFLSLVVPLETFFCDVFCHFSFFIISVCPLMVFFFLFSLFLYYFPFFFSFLVCYFVPLWLLIFVAWANSPSNGFDFDLCF